MEYENERRELDELYGQAQAELGEEKLVVWVGGDAPNQQDALMRKFESRFPNVSIDLTVDLSKFHDGRVYQGLMDGELVADVVMLQTANDFEDWKAMGVLENYKPESFSHLIPGFGDEDGAFLGAYIACFVPQLVGGGRGYEDFLRPELKDMLVLTYPHDDDAVLFVYDHILQKYGAGFLDRLAGQNPRFLRGTAAPAALVGKNGYLGNLTGYMGEAGAFVPEEDFFISWPQRAAMFKLTRHKAAARLFLAWITSHEYQASSNAWSVRDDIAAPEGLRMLSEYDNTDPLGFVAWMRDRKKIADLRRQMKRVFGEVIGVSPLEDPELLRVVP